MGSRVGPSPAPCLALGTQRPLRILCARETQQSIRESVHQLLSEQIKMLHLEYHYRVLDFTIRGANGTEFIFVGLRNLSIEQIKSFESIDVVWIEEAAQVGRKSWQTLIPTIRKPGSEIWVSFNPDLATDDTYVRWVVRPPPGAKVVQTSWHDNAWLSAESRAEIELLYETDPESAEHVYGGSTRSTVAGAIYRKEIMAAEHERRITDVPYDASLPVQTFWDLGWSDLVSIWFVQCSGFAYRLIDYHQDNYQTMDHYLQVLQGKGYTYSRLPGFPACTLPWDATSKMAQTSLTGPMAAKGFTTRILQSESRFVGIDATRKMFGRLWFDAEKCADGLAGLRRYQWGDPPKDGTTKREPLHDAASHPADALRTMAMGLRTPEPKEEKRKPERRGPTVYAPFG